MAPKGRQRRLYSKLVTIKMKQVKMQILKSRRYILTIFLYVIVQSCFSQNPLIKVLNNKRFDEIKINFSKIEFNKYLVTERTVNISDGEVYWQKENIDTFLIRCLEDSKTEIIYEIVESKNDLINSFYDKSLQDLIKDNFIFPTIKYTKNKNTKNGFYSDSCKLAKEAQYHLLNRIKLLKQINEYSNIPTLEKQIKNIENCKIGNYSILQNSRILIALDNYLAPTELSDTLKYQIVQKEHFGIETKIASYITNKDNGNKLINFVQFEEEQNDKIELSNIISLLGKDMSESQINDYINILSSIKNHNHTIIELDSNNQVIRFFSKINIIRTNIKGGSELRFYNYEIKRIDSH